MRDKLSVKVNVYAHDRAYLISKRVYVAQRCAKGGYFTSRVCGYGLISIKMRRGKF